MLARFVQQRTKRVQPTGPCGSNGKSKKRPGSNNSSKKKGGSNSGGEKKPGSNSGSKNSVVRTVVVNKSVVPTTTRPIQVVCVELI